MLRDVFEGLLPDYEFLKTCIGQVTKFKPTILVVSQDQFTRYKNTIYLHGYAGYLRSNFIKLGIDRIIYADYLPDGEFELTSEESYQNLGYEVETLTFKPES